jgi:hypothetical protein
VEKLNNLKNKWAPLLPFLFDLGAKVARGRAPRIDRDAASQSESASAIHLAHPARPKSGRDFVGRGRTRVTPRLSRVDEPLSKSQTG